MKVLGCSKCKLPYDYSSGIHYDDSKAYAHIPLCRNDEEHTEGYTDELVEIIPKQEIGHILDFIDEQRDNGNIEGEKGFSPDLCLSEVIKRLKKL